MTIAGLARASSIDHQVLVKLESEVGSRVAWERAERIAQALGRPADELFTADRIGERGRKRTRSRPATPPTERLSEALRLADLETARLKDAEGLLDLDELTASIVEVATAEGVKLSSITARSYVCRGQIEPKYRRIHGLKRYLFEVAERDRFLEFWRATVGPRLELHRKLRSNEAHARSFILERQPSDQRAPARGRTRQVWEGRLQGRKHGALGGKPRGYSEQQADQVREVRKHNPKLGIRPIAERTGLSRRQVEAILRDTSAVT